MYSYPGLCLCVVFLVVLAGVFAAVVCARRRQGRTCPLEQQQLLDDLRARLLSSPSLRDRHPDAARVLRQWSLLPHPEGARTDPSTKTIHMAVADPDGQPFDRVTLVLVLLHEVAHAVGGADGAAEHDAQWARRQAALVEAAVDDGLLLSWQDPDPGYPTQILGQAQVLAQLA